MSFVDCDTSTTAHRIRAVLKPGSRLLGSLVLCALVPAAFLGSMEGGTPQSAQSARVSFVGLDLSTPDGALEGRERVRKAARDLCVRAPGQRSLDWCVDNTVAAAEQQIRRRTTKVSLADLDLATPQGVHGARDRLQTAARRACQELQTGGAAALTQYSVCVDESFAHALRQAYLLQRFSVDF